MYLHDEQVGKMLELLDRLGIADNTIVMYSTDNGPHYNSWPDAGITPFRSEKNTNWEGAFRVFDLTVASAQDLHLLPNLKQVVGLYDMGDEGIVEAFAKHGVELSHPYA